MLIATQSIARRWLCLLWVLAESGCNTGRTLSQPTVPSTHAQPDLQQPDASLAPVSATLLQAGATLASHNGSLAALGTGLGRVHVVPADARPVFISESTTISAKLGTSFGVEVVLQGPSNMTIVPVLTRVTHPPIANPETGVTQTVDEWNSPMNVGIPRYTGWSFDNPWELVSGRWVIEVLDNRRPIIRQEFIVERTPP